MESKKKRFIARNDPFICQNCGEDNPVLQRSCRNHCRTCLFSKHVDKDIPGDRRHECQGMLEPIGLDHRGNKGFLIMHRCLTCKKEMLNIAAQDDNFDALICLIKKPFQ